MSDINTYLTNFKAVYLTQVDLSYFLQIAPLVFKDQTTYSNIKSDVQFINQIGAAVFNYFNQRNPEEQKIWFESLINGLNQGIADANALIALVPAGDPNAANLIILLNVFITDFNSILAVIPPI